MTALENQFDNIEARLDYVASELKKVRGRQFALEKSRKDDPQPDNEPEPSLHDGGHQPRPVMPTAFLARRFKGG